MAEARLTALIEANTKAFENSLKRLETLSAGSFARQARSAQKLDATLAGIVARATTLGKTLGSALGGLGLGSGIVLSVSGLAAAFSNAAKKAGDLSDAAAKIGVGTKSLQELQYAAGQSGIEIEALRESLARFGKSLSDARAGSGDLSELFAANGIDEARAKLLTFDQALDVVANLMNRAANAQDKLKIAQIAFGRGGLDLVNLFGGGAKAVDEMRASAEKLGVVMADDLVQAGAKVDDELVALEARFGTFADTALLNALKVVEAIGMIEHAIADAMQPSQSAEGLARSAGARAGQDIAGRPAVKRVDEAFDNLAKNAGELSASAEDAATLGKAAEEAASSVTKLGDAAAAASKAAAKMMTGAAADAADLIRKFEGFKANAFYDVNAYRVGYSSDTKTMTGGLEGGIGLSRPVTASDTSTIAEAERDLARRISEIQAAIATMIGPAALGKLTSGSLAALTSVAYQYGSIPAAGAGLAAAAKTGDPFAISGEIAKLGGVPKSRQLETAQVALQGTPGSGSSIAGLQAQSAAMDDATKKSEELATAKQDLIATTERETAALGLEAKTYGESTFEKERAKEFQDLYNQSVAAGIPLTADYIAKLHDLADAHANAVTAVEAARTAEDDLQTAQQSQIAQMDELRSFSSGVLSGFISDMVHGKSASEALAGALSKIADKLLDIASNQIISALFGAQGTAGGGLLGSFLGIGGASAGAQSVALTDPFFGLAKGGIMTGRGPVPLKRYASGGIASQPQMAVFGEGSRPEAYVPLPDGRRIPVTLRAPRMAGGGRQKVDVNTTNVVKVEPSPMFITAVESRSQQAEANALRRAPEYLSNVRARQAGSAR